MTVNSALVPVADLPESIQEELRRREEYILETTNEQIDAAAAKAEEPESQEAAEEGDYEKGHIKLYGLEITIENAKGSTRKGIGRGGKPWQVTMPAHYGFVDDTVSSDGEGVDVYIGDSPDSDVVYVVDQLNLDTGDYDEAKCMLAFKDLESARETYIKGFSDGKGADRIGHIGEMPVEVFKEWAQSKQSKDPLAGELDEPTDSQIVKRKKGPDIKITQHKSEIGDGVDIALSRKRGRAWKPLYTYYDVCPLKVEAELAEIVDMVKSDEWHAIHESDFVTDRKTYAAIEQPNDYTCGPSVIYMIDQALGAANTSLDDISKMSYTNPITGTLPMFLSIALRKLGVKHRKTRVNVHTLATELNNGNICAVLSVCVPDGLPHWILVVGTDGSSFVVNDPADGKQKVLSHSDMEQALNPANMERVFRPVGFLIGTAFSIKERAVQESQEQSAAKVQRLPEHGYTRTFQSSAPGRSLTVVVAKDGSQAGLLQNTPTAQRLVTYGNLRGLSSEMGYFIESLEAWMDTNVDSLLEHDIRSLPFLQKSFSAFLQDFNTTTEPELSLLEFDSDSRLTREAVDEACSKRLSITSPVAVDGERITLVPAGSMWKVKITESSLPETVFASSFGQAFSIYVDRCARLGLNYADSEIEKPV